jgi:hypothetical protein
MPDISLTDFVDFVIKSGTPKLTKVRQLKARGKYNPAHDFWRGMRKGIRAWHETDGSDLSALDCIVDDCEDIKKLPRYAAALRGYRRFIGRRHVTWFDPPWEDWKHGSLRVRVNPELGLKIDGVPHVVKMYFKDERLTKLRTGAVLALMEAAVRTKAPARAKMAVLEVSSGKLYPASADTAMALPLLRGEAASFTEIWNSV